MILRQHDCIYGSERECENLILHFFTLADNWRKMFLGHLYGVDLHSISIPRVGWTSDIKMAVRTTRSMDGALECDFSGPHVYDAAGGVGYSVCHGSKATGRRRRSGKRKRKERKRKRVQYRDALIGMQYYMQRKHSHKMFLIPEKPTKNRNTS